MFYLLSASGLTTLFQFAGAISKMSITAESVAIEDAIRRALKDAGDRDGGRKRRHSSMDTDKRDI